MTVEDFAAIYAANPDEAATRVHMDFPTNAKTYMTNQWSQLGMQGSPEDFFRRNPMASAPVAARTASVPMAPVTSRTGLASSWTPFANEMERTLAMNQAGPLAYDPTYAGPLQKAYAMSEENRRAEEAAQRSAYEQKFFPLRNSGTPEEIVRAQLAGDRGDTKRILQSLQGIDPDTALQAPPLLRRPLEPFIPKDGFGGIPNPEGMQSSIDFELINDPEFAELRARDPDRAAFVYRSLTGRSYDTDLKAHNATIDKRDKIGLGFVESQLKQGARLNPNTGEWLVMNTEEPEDITGFGSVRPVRRLTKATPEQQNWFDRYYQRVVGLGLPQNRKADRGSQLHLSGTMSRLAPEQFALAEQEIQLATKELGYEPPIHQQLAIIAKIVQQQARNAPHPITRTLDAFGNAILNLPMSGGIPQPYTSPSGLTPEEEAAILASNPNLQ